jgi:serine phosphatase RsbU (regulator of sigma subunit)
MARRYVIEAVEEATEAERAALAVAAFDRDLRVAHDIQMGLLPSERPAIAGYDVAGMARPAAQAGGDYYDWQPLPDGRLVVAIADVTGHGIGPALVMAVCRAYSRASAPTTDGPQALMERLNDLIYEDVKGARFITMVLAVISASGDVEMVSAGHGPTLLYRAASNDVERFDGDGLPLGVVANESYGPRRDVRLERGDVLLMLTDGFFEYFRAGDDQQYGTERLASALRANAAGSPAQIIAAIDKSVTDFANGAPQNDDMTAVAIKRQ